MLTRLRRQIVWGFGALALLTMFVMAAPVAAEIEAGMEMGIDHPGNDFTVYAISPPDPGLCRQACELYEQCATWTFVKPGVMQANAVCALKFLIAPAQANQNVISGVKGQTSYATGGGARVENLMGIGMDLPGGDLGIGKTLESSDPALCAERCEAHDKCQSWTFGRPGGPNQPAVCWLKRTVPNPVVNASTISARRATPLPSSTPAVSGAVPPTGTGFGVWAYVIGVNAGNFADPCQIQYVAVGIPGNRYDADPDYRRVRARFTMEDASNDVTFFSVFMQDQPDGVVKFRPCSTATDVLPTRPGGPGTSAGPVFAVWAYTIGTATFADPCAIQYVRSRIDGNRFDGNSRYMRVAAEISGSEASRLVTRFSAFMEDQPDGVIKLISCAEFKKLDADLIDDPQQPPPIGNPPQDIAAWMTGVFDSNFGVTTFSPSGGSYTNSNGTLATTSINGATMEGTWTQANSGGQCEDKTHRGRFRITFTADGFSGLWSYCDKEPNYGWTGTRRR